MLIVSIFRAGRRRLVSLSISLVVLVLVAGLVGWPLWLPAAAWTVASLVLLAVWWVLEKPLLALWGYRQPSVVEAARLQPALTAIQNALGCAAPPVLAIADSAAVEITAGLRTLIVTRGALEVLEDPQLAGLLAHEFGHLEAAEAAADTLVWLASAPVVLAWWTAEVLCRLAAAVAFGMAAALVLPLVLWPVGFTRLVGAALAVVLIAIASLLLMATGLETEEGGLVAWGLGVLLAPILFPLVRVILAWEQRAAERRADQTAVEAELGRELLEALRIVQQLEEEERAPGGPAATLLRKHPPTESRIEALERALIRSNEPA